MSVLYGQSAQLSTEIGIGNDPGVTCFGDRLFALTRSLGHDNNSELARLLGLSRPRIQALLNAIFPPDLPTLQLLSQTLGVPIEAFLEGVRTAKMPRPVDALAETFLVSRPPQKHAQKRKVG